ncbi:hypothetical protein CVT26_013897 [Gymnopilus dilepis]|uniref:Carbonic anhydrase n=1 Tax=Gymnopilus dilepis TaxID=231916 RepID=A0A409WDR3_9AGAR|nr:hypothetical protein CVT26_013897 [Gymnopilus dilepis]
MSAHETFAAHNDAFVSTFNQGDLKLTVPNKKLVVITCMDARVDPAAQLGIAIGDAHVLRNGGGSAREALRSILISQRLLGTREIAVFHHTDCGMFTFTNESLSSKIKSESPGDLDVAIAVDEVNFRAAYANLDESVAGDVKFLKEHPLVMKDTVVTGWVHETHTGRVKRVV